MAALNGSSNNFPEGQCTRWASERYHQLTGYYVPFGGDAHQWAANAVGYGWQVSSKPVVPSIICLQGGIQGADYVYGHVAVVESMQGNTIVTSDLNWGPNPSQVTTVNFHAGPGVSFIYATGSNNRPLGQQSSGLVDMVTSFVSGQGSSNISIAPTADVTDLLVTFDQALKLTNPFNVANVQQDSIAGVASFTDPISWLEGFGFNIVDDFVAMSIRLIFVIVGVVVILKVLGNFIDFGAIADTARAGIGLAAIV